jgi:hypothetical protein
MSDVLHRREAGNIEHQMVDVALVVMDQSKRPKVVRGQSEECAGTDATERREARRYFVIRRFSETLNEIGPLCGEGWSGAWASLHDGAPLLVRSVAGAETAVDELALSFIQGRASLLAFEIALTEYQRAWMRAVERMRDLRLAMAERRCADCRRSTFIAGFRDEDGTIWCRRCWSGG